MEVNTCVCVCACVSLCAREGGVGERADVTKAASRSYNKILTRRECLSLTPLLSQIYFKTSVSVAPLPRSLSLPPFASRSLFVSVH